MMAVYAANCGSGRAWRCRAFGMTCPAPQSHCTGQLPLAPARGLPRTRSWPSCDALRHTGGQARFQPDPALSNCAAKLRLRVLSSSAHNKSVQPVCCSAAGDTLEGGCKTADSGRPAANACNDPDILCQQLYITRSARPAVHKRPGQSLADNPAHGLRSPRLPATSNHRGRGVRPAY